MVSFNYKTIFTNKISVFIVALEKIHIMKYTRFKIRESCQFVSQKFFLP